MLLVFSLAVCLEGDQLSILCRRALEDNAVNLNHVLLQWLEIVCVDAGIVSTAVYMVCVNEERLQSVFGNLNNLLPLVIPVAAQ